MHTTTTILLTAMLPYRKFIRYMKLKYRPILSVLIAATVVMFATSCVSVSDKQTAAQREAAQQRLQAAHMQPDDLGRRGFGMQHELNPEQLAELSDVRVFAGADEAHISRIMRLMGSNYSWYASDASLRSKTGVLILSHGLGNQGDKQLRASVQDSPSDIPTTFAFGMSMTTSEHIQLALDELIVAGAERVIVVPVLSTRHNSLMRQWRYIFSLDPDPEYTHVPNVVGPVEIIFSDALDDHPIVGKIVADHAREMSSDPEAEEVIIVGHGPVDADDNADQLALMENIAVYLRADRNYAAVHVATLQDDAPREVRMANFKKLRERVTEAQDAGRNVIIVTNLLGSRIVQSSLRRGLSGLAYRYNFKGLIAHEDFVGWIEASIEENSTGS